MKARSRTTCNGLATTINADNNTITENYAVFGEVSYDLFDGKIVPLVGGAHVSRQAHASRTATNSLPSTKDVNTWRVNLSWLPTDDLTMFATVSTGFRAGIVQSQVQVEVAAAGRCSGEHRAGSGNLEELRSGAQVANARAERCLSA